MGGDEPTVLSVFGWEIESLLDKQQSDRHWQIILGASSIADHRILGDGSGAGASCLLPDEQGLMTCPFLVDEVRAAINGVNAEGAPGLDEIPVFFCRDC